MSKEPFNLEEISKKMDSLSITILSCISEILRERQYLEDNLKEGYINMAKSRYIMRGQSISISQINSSNLKSTLKSSSSLSTLEGIEYMNWTPLDLTDSAIKNDKKCMTVSNELSENIKNIKITSNESNGNKESGLNVENDTHTKSCDPLKCFGVLVPDVLKKSQMRFKQATFTALHIASLQNQFNNLCAKYKTLKQLKNQCVEK